MRSWSPVHGARAGGRSVDRAYRRVTAARRPLPDYLIIGAQRAGTASLHDFLSAHPSVAPPSKKEVHYFSLNATRSLDWYRSHFPSGARVTGEASPYYLFHPRVPGQVARVLPEVKIIVLLRNPIDRAHSHYTHERVFGREPLEFEEALAREPERLAGEEERLISDPAYNSFEHQRYSYLARGAYAEQLRRWLGHFPPERLFLVSSEEFRADPADTVLAVERFLGLEPYVPEDLARRHVNTYQPMGEDLRERLRRHFAPSNAALFELIGRDLNWS